MLHRTSAAAAHADTAGTNDGGEPTALWFLTALLEKRRTLAAAAAGALAAALVVTALLPQRFVAVSTFAPQSSQGSVGRYASLANQLGFNLGPVAGSEGVDFYNELLQGPGFLRDVALSEVASKPGSTAAKANLLAIYEVGGATAEDSLDRAVRQLQRDLTVRTSLKRNFVEVETRANTREVAVALNQRILSLVEAFDLEKRQTQAGAERRFIEERLKEAERNLQAAEGYLQSFLEQNRAYQASPQLAFEAARRQRRVDLAQQVHSTLAQSYQQARIEEVRNLPVITVVSRPESTVRREPKPYVGNGLLAVTLALSLVVAWSLSAAYLDRQRLTHPAEFEAFDRARPRLLRRSRRTP